ncbi:serine acetyltransferase [Fulvivirga maritima]|uniref:serine O-acetyltransferase n=1 Tax=Fulvivirga maritima TaxID=2904247 RepID=UPI001F39EDBB|nr:serine acetyltransferase [Fulvivirga maritima]UII24589.1 serine acetyltransferase [Fulvivirga maritima]
MDKNFINKLYQSHTHCKECPPGSLIHSFFEHLLGLLFPNFANEPVRSEDELNNRIEEVKTLLNRILVKNQNGQKNEQIIADFFDSVEIIFNELQTDIEATYLGDPAAKSKDEIVRAYPGFYAIAAYRIAHQLYKQNIENIPRLITEYAHSKTGIDIHPGAKIGQYFCIDHGTGIVIGETAVIGENVKLYQGVTLGALSVRKEDALIQRHPTIEDHVIIYAGATILGGNTVVGHHSVIGGNVWLTSSVAPNSKIYYKAHMHNELDKTTDTIIYKP